MLGIFKDTGYLPLRSPIYTWHIPDIL